MSAVEAKLAELGLTLPEVVPPLAAYQPAVQSGPYVYTSGQLPMLGASSRSPARSVPRSLRTRRRNWPAPAR